MNKQHLAIGGLVTAVVLFLVALPIAGTTESSAELWVKERFGLSEPSVCAQPVSSSGWEDGPSLPFARDEPRAVAVGDDIYVAGGLTALVSYGTPSDVAGVATRTEVRSTDSFVRLNTRAGTYTDLQRLPEPLNHVGLAAYDGDVYLVGGHGNLLDGATPKDLFYRYSPSTDRWSRLPRMPTPRGAAATAVIGDRLYVAGGMRRGAALNVLEIFDFRTGTWSRGKDMPSRREHIAAAVIRGQLYVIGGRNSLSEGFGADDALRTVERYDPVADRWTTVASLPVGTGGVAATAFDGSILAMGGNDERRREVIGAVQRYDADRDTWVELEEMRTARHGFGIAVVGDGVYTLGGSPCGSYGITDAVEIFRPHDAPA